MVSDLNHIERRCLKNQWLLKSETLQPIFAVAKLINGLVGCFLKNSEVFAGTIASLLFLKPQWLILKTLDVA